MIARRTTSSAGRRSPAARGKTRRTAAATARGELRVGVGTADITPPRPELLKPTGMGRLVGTRGVLDPLRVEALALRAGGELAFVTTSDLRTIPIEPEFGPEVIQRAVARATGCDWRRVLLSATHNHCSSPEAADSSPSAQAANRAAYRKIVNGFVQACVAAMKSLRPAELAGAAAELPEPIGTNRRFRLSNGTCVNCWGAGPVVPPGHRYAAPAGPDSRRVDLLVARQVGAEAPFALLVCYPTHPHLYELPYFSGEFPGASKRRLEQLIPGCTVLHTSSTGGNNDLHVVHPKPDYEPEQVRWFRNSADLLAERMSKAVLPALPARGFRRPAALRHEYFDSRPQETPGSTRRTLINAVALGDFAFVSMPGELFVELGQKILGASPFPHTMLMGYNGSREGYAPLPLAFEQGSYEIMRGPGPEVDPPDAPLRSLRARPWTGTRIAERVLEVLGRLR